MNENTLHISSTGDNVALIYLLNKQKPIFEKNKSGNAIITGCVNESTIGKKCIKYYSV